MSRMDFYKRIEYVCGRIPYGRAATYGQIALLCGKPGNSRQVGYALRTGRAGGDLPAHRIINSQGYLTGALSFSYPEEQKLLLEAEGIPVRRTPRGWRAELSKCAWRPTLEEAEAFREYFQRAGI